MNFLQTDFSWKKNDKKTIVTGNLIWLVNDSSRMNDLQKNKTISPLAIWALLLLLFGRYMVNFLRWKSVNPSISSLFSLLCLMVLFCLVDLLKLRWRLFLIKGKRLLHIHIHYHSKMLCYRILENFKKFQFFIAKITADKV